MSKKASVEVPPVRFALVDGQRHQARPSLAGECPICGSPVIARCGEVNVWHWAHQRSRSCDMWWENETEWHRAWKIQFPDEWQEIVHHAESGERHVADVKTPAGWAIEFQHSHIAPEERRSRNEFYGKLVWVVNATRRSRDAPQLLKGWEQGRPVGDGFVRRILSEECRLLREWADSHVPTFFDSGEDSLWWLLKADRDHWAYLAKFPRAQFLQIHREQTDGGFDQFVKDIDGLVRSYESHLRATATPRPLQDFTGYITRARRSRRL